MHNHGDIVAAKDNKVFLIDCKTLENKSGTFDLNRVEQNQVFSMRKFNKCGNYNYFLAILYQNNVYFVLLTKELLENNKTINVNNYVALWRNFYNDK